MKGAGLVTLRVIKRGVIGLVLCTASPAVAAELPRSIICSNFNELDSAVRPMPRSAYVLFQRLLAIPRPTDESHMAGYVSSLAAVVSSATADNIRLNISAAADASIAHRYFSLGNVQKAAEHLSRAISAQSDRANDIDDVWTKIRNYTYRAIVFQALGQHRPALADYQFAQQLGCQGLEKNIEDLSTRLAFAERAAKLIQEAETRGRDAEQMNDFRGALGIYIAALRELASQAELPGSLTLKAIRAAGKIVPPPPIPEEARKHAVFAQTAFKEAKAAADFKEAQEQYTRALALAPWWADAWVTLSAVHEKLDNFAAAATDLENYLRAAPGAPDRDQVQNKIYELQFKAQRKRAN